MDGNPKLVQNSNETTFGGLKLEECLFIVVLAITISPLRFSASRIAIRFLASAKLISVFSLTLRSPATSEPTDQVAAISYRSPVFQRPS